MTSREERDSPPSADGEFWPALWAVTAAFGTYFCMYAFRKPFTAAAFADSAWRGIDYKTILVTAQVGGYMLSKVIGIKVIAEMVPHRRAMMLLSLIALAEGALVLFGLLPRPWSAWSLFFNGLSLGMVYGLVVGFLEGRRLTELLTAGLCSSFIVADGIVKSVGAWLLQQGVSEDWMPAAAGALFLVPFALCVTMLARISPPTPEDVSARNERPPMNRDERWGFLRRHAVGLFPLLLMFLLVTVVRSIRSDYALEIWRGLGSPAAPATFTQSEMIVALGVLAANGCAVLFADNRRAFLSSLLTCGAGFALMALAQVMRSANLVGDFHFMVLLGLGLYLPYVAMHTTVFERLLGLTRDRGNLGFLMYVADSIGYLGFVVVMLARNFLPAIHDVVRLLTIACWLTVGLSSLCLVVSGLHFARRETPVTALAPIESEA